MGEKLPEGWVWTTLDNICTIVMGQSPPSSEYNEKKEGLPFFQGKAEFTDFYPQVKKWCKSPMKIAEPNDILLSVRAPVGPTNVASSQCCIGRGLAAIRPEGSINFRYILYVIRNFNSSLTEVATGSTFEAISGDDIRTFTLPLSPLREQSRIVSVIEQQFTRLDSAVASLKSARARIKQYRASLLKSALEGELTREWRAEHSVSETGELLLARILQERRARWEEEQLRKMREKGVVPKDDTWKEKYEEPQEPDVEKLPELPEGWCWATVDQLLLESPCNGISIKGSDTPPGFPALKLSAMSDSGFNYDDRRYIPISNDTAELLAIQKGDFFVSRGNGSLHLVGRGTLAQPPPERIVFPDTIIRLRFINIGLLRYYIASIWPGSFVRKQIKARARTTAGIYKISQADIKSFILPLPPLAEQKQIVAEVEASLSNIAKLEETTENNLRRADHERQSILQEAFAGRLVPQDPNDEPASILLERIREERKKREEVGKVLKAGRKGNSMEAAKKRRAKKVAAGEAGVGLYEVLVEAGEPLRPEEVFRLVGLKTEDQPESVEAFYVELRDDVAEGLIGVTHPDTTTVLLEALDGSAEEEEELLPMEQVEDAEEERELAEPLQEEGEKVSSEWPTLWDELDNE